MSVIFFLFFNFNPYIFLLFIFVFDPLYKSFFYVIILVLKIIICHILIFPICFLFFLFLIFFHDSFVKVFLVFSFIIQ
jgi:hypothetical protein